MDEVDVIEEVTSGPVVYFDELNGLHEDLLAIDNDLTRTNDLLEHITFGIDILIIIVIVFFVFSSVFNFFSRGFKDV